MRKLFCASLLIPAVLSAGTLKEDLKFVLDADTPAPAGVKVSGSVRFVPGKFGKGYLIERRTINYFKPEDVILSDNATLKGASNKLILPAGGVAALPQSGVKPKYDNTLSFLASGEGKITVTVDHKEIKVITLDAGMKPYSVSFAVPADSFTLRIASDKGATLDQVMFDRNISFVNSYHKPGPMRNVDCLYLPPASCNPQQGAFAFWVKAPWFDTVNKKISGISFFNILWTEKTLKRWTDNIVRCSGVWEDYAYDNFYGDKGTFCSSGFKLRERKVVPADGWNFIVLNWKSENGKLSSEYILNGTQKFNSVKPFQHRSAPCSFTIGYGGGSYLNGVLDDFAIFNRPLTQEEIKQIYDAGKPLKEVLK